MNESDPNPSRIPAVAEAVLKRVRAGQLLVESALTRGSKAADLEFAPTLLNGPDEACPPLEERPTFPERPWWLAQWTPKPWWKFW